MAYIDKTIVKGTTYDIQDSSAVHSVNGTTPDATGNVAVTRASIGAADDTAVVKHNVAQSLTTAQKTQARTNIGAAGDAELTTLSNNVAANLGIVETGTTATHNIEQGQYVIWNGVLYTADSAINIGETLVTSGGSKNLSATENGGLNMLNASLPANRSRINRWLRFDPTNKKGLVIKAGTSLIRANGSPVYFAVDTKIDLTANLGQVGKDYGVYLLNDGTITAVLLTSAPANSVKIGRFHTLCANVGTITNMQIAMSPSCGYAVGDNVLVKPYRQDEDPDFYAFYNKTITAVTVQDKYDVVACHHPLSGFEAGDILPESIFCLSWFPDTLYEDAMAYDKETDIPIDIYLQSGTGLNTRSAYNATHTVNREEINHTRDLMTVGKRPLTDHEFTAAALGSNERTNITGSSDKTYVGGHMDTSNRRMISAIGIEEMCGYLWQWLDEIGDVGGADWKTYDSHASFGQSYGTIPYCLLGGGSWNDSSYCGSRSRTAYDPRSHVSTTNGGRGASRMCYGKR